MPNSRYGSDRIAIEIVKPAKGPKTVLRINGRDVKAPRAPAAVLACLHENAGRVVPYARLCKALGQKRFTPDRKHLLRQYALLIRKILAAHKASYVLTVANDLGYALCEIAE